MLRINKYSFNTFQTSTKSVGTTNPCAKNSLSIFYYNDTHGNTDKMHAVMEAAKNFQTLKKDTVHLTLSGGDNVSGGDAEKNALVFDVMQNAMNVDASAAGNHEFDALLHNLIENAKSHKTKFVATNVEFDSDNEAREFIERSTIIEKNGVKFGLVGAMPLDFESCTKKAVQDGVEVMDFEDSIEAIQKEVDNLKKQGIDKIILLSHTGFENDQKMAASLSGVDIIIGGHSHSVVDGATKGENVVSSKSGEPVIITQAGENGKYYGVLDVEFDAQGVLTKISNQLTPISSKKSPVIEYIKKQKLGDSPVVGTIKDIDEMPVNRRIAPHGWGNLIVDSMRAELDTDVAFINAANIRKVPAQGTLTQRDITESAPMKNRLIKTKVTQKQMVDAIRNSASQSLGNSAGEPGLLYASGIEYKVDEKGTLLELSVVDKKGNKTKIDINNPSETITYSAAYDDFTMRADGEYPDLAPKFEVQYFDYDKDTTAIKYIEKMQNKNDLKVIDDGRLEIVKTSQVQQPSNNNQKFLNLTAPKAS